MKAVKYSLIGLFMVIISINTEAQLIRFGVKGGVNTSSLKIQNADYNKLITGGHVGLWLNAPIIGSFSVQPELLFTQKGSKSVYSGENSTVTTNVKLGLDYVEMPVHLVYRVFRNVELEAGPYWGYLLNQQAVTNFETGNMSFDYFNSLDKSDFEQFDLGMSLGARVLFKRLYLGVNYKAGFEPVAKENNLTALLLGEATNQNFQVYLALPF